MTASCSQIKCATSVKVNDENFHSISPKRLTINRFNDGMTLHPHPSRREETEHTLESFQNEIQNSVTDTWEQ